MKFEFDTTTDGPTEAAALATALAVLHGSAVALALDKAASNMAVTDPDPLASDGHPFNVADHATHGKTETAPPPPEPIGGWANTKTAPAVDTAGLPWDERIHASTKTTNKDGTWSRRRNTPDATFDTVMAELIAARDGAEATAPAPEPSAAAAFAPESELPVAAQEAKVETVVPPPPPAPPAEASSGAAVPPPPATSTLAASTTTVSFPALMVKITKAQTAGKIDKATVDGFLGAFGLDKIAGLASAGADTIAAVNAMVDEHVGA